jgi:predicted XRE-type DNA-binding protein
MSEKFTSVWDALIEDKAEAKNLQVRSDLMIAITEYIKDNKLTQKNAAELLKVKQPRISDIVNGKIDKFTVDTLLNMLTLAGIEVELSITPTKKHSEVIEVIIENAPWPCRVITNIRKKVISSTFDYGIQTESRISSKSEISEELACVGIG